jgi:hypothetical protein
MFDTRVYIAFVFTQFNTFAVHMLPIFKNLDKFIFYKEEDKENS